MQALVEVFVLVVREEDGEHGQGCGQVVGYVGQAWFGEVDVREQVLPAVRAFGGQGCFEVRGVVGVQVFQPVLGGVVQPEFVGVVREADAGQAA